MSVQVPPRGSHGVAFPRLPGRLVAFVNGVMFRLYRNRLFQGANVLSLATIGAKSGLERRTTVMYFPDEADAWLVVASKGGAATHPDWFFNLARNPDRVWIEMGSRKLRVQAQTLAGEERAKAWPRIIRQSPVFAGYQTKTDRELPVVRLSAVG